MSHGKKDIAGESGLLQKLLRPFEEQDWGIGLASDVVKVEGDNPATPGCL